MNETTNLPLFLGRLHPLLVHLPIGFLVLLGTLESLARLRQFHRANACAGYVSALLVPAAAVSAACGWLLATSGEYDGNTLRFHRWLGVTTVLLCVLVAIAHSRQWTRIYTLTLYSSLLLLVLTSHFGGLLTHGNDYLARYAPVPLKVLLGRQTATSGAEIVHRGKGAFPLLVQPVLQARCTACHNQEKHKGGLRLDTFEWLRKGGENGPVVVAGKAADSPMFKRLLRPAEDEDHMPPTGKPQPTPEEIALLGWWIDAGAPSDATLDDLHPPPAIRRAMERLGRNTN
jgi:uncharacterized membrane protein